MQNVDDVWFWNVPDHRAKHKETKARKPNENDERREKERVFCPTGRALQRALRAGGAGVGADAALGAHRLPRRRLEPPRRAQLPTEEVSEHKAAWPCI